MIQCVLVTKCGCSRSITRASATPEILLPLEPDLDPIDPPATIPEAGILYRRFVLVKRDDFMQIAWYNER